MQLSQSQQAAVDYAGGHLLIVAGPGTGKTHTITHRIARQIPSLKPDTKILAITFTNKAAQEMRERLETLEVDASRVFVGTFHRFCLTILRRYAHLTPLPAKFSVALEGDIDALTNNLWPQATASQRRRKLDEISLLKSTRMAIEPNEDFTRYHRYLRQAGMIDFDDILRETLLLLDNQEIVVQELRREYPFIYVDEYQDINPIQVALLKALVDGGVRLTVIGDPRQSIYGFRGSRVEIFQKFTEDFPGAITMTLKEHYRSRANLLEASTQLISSQSKDFELVAHIYTQGRLTVHQAATDRAEAEYVAHQIEKLIGGTDMHRASGGEYSFKDIAILFRLNSQRHVLIQALDHVGIPYQISNPRQITDRVVLTQEQADEAALHQREEELGFNVEKVSLLTLHAAKGLEFPVVFIVGCEQDLLPLNLENMKGDAQEERRLFYVGMTRAKDILYLTHAKRRQIFGKTVFLPPSPFLSDIEEKLKNYATAKPPKIVKADSEKQQLKLF